MDTARVAAHPFLAGLPDDEAAAVVATSPIRALALSKRDVWALDRLAPEAAQRFRAALGERTR